MQSSWDPAVGNGPAFSSIKSFPSDFSSSVNLKASSELPLLISLWNNSSVFQSRVKIGFGAGEITGWFLPWCSSREHIWIMESQNHLGWKSPVRSSSPTIYSAVPHPPLKYVPKCHISVCFKYIQGSERLWWVKFWGPVAPSTRGARVSHTCVYVSHMAHGTGGSARGRKAELRGESKPQILRCACGLSDGWALLQRKVSGPSMGSQTSDGSEIPECLT